MDINISLQWELATEMLKQARDLSLSPSPSTESPQAFPPQLWMPLLAFPKASLQEFPKPFPALPTPPNPIYPVKSMQEPQASSIQEYF